MNELPEPSSPGDAVIGAGRSARKPPEYGWLHVLAGFVLTVVLLLLAGFFLVFLGGLALFSQMAGNGRQWSLDARNAGDAPCTLIVTLDSADGRRLEFKNLPVEKGYADRELIKEKGFTKVHSIRVVGQGGKERTFMLDQVLPEGSEMKIRIDGDLNIETDVDLDAHMGFDRGSGRPLHRANRGGSMIVLV